MAGDGGENGLHVIREHAGMILHKRVRARRCR